jgi:hypothetical protein
MPGRYIHITKQQASTVRGGHGTSSGLMKVEMSDESTQSPFYGDRKA